MTQEQLNAEIQLIVAIVNSDDANGVIDALTARGYRVTRINTAGGFLKESNATLLIGTEPSRVQDILKVLQANSRTRTQFINPLPPVMEPGEMYMPYPVEVQVGGATVFVLDVERYEHF